MLLLSRHALHAYKCGNCRACTAATKKFKEPSQLSAVWQKANTTASYAIGTFIYAPCQVLLPDSACAQCHTRQRLTRVSVAESVAEAEKSEQNKQHPHLTDLQKQRLWVKVVLLGVLHLQPHSLRTNLQVQSCQH